MKPKRLFDRYKERIDNFKKALPQLEMLGSRFDKKPQVAMHEGKEGLIQIMEDTLTVKDKVIYNWNDIDKAVGSCLKDYYPECIKKKVALGVWVKAILTYSEAAVKFKDRGASELRDVLIISSKDFPIVNEINVYDDKVAIISHEDEVGVIIQNKAIAETQRSIFNMFFEHFKAD